MRVRVLALLSAAALFGLAAVPASASAAKFNPPKSFYLALGDSLAFGYQQGKFLANYPAEKPSAFTTGYVDDFSTMLRAIDPGIETVNFGCPGETTASFIGGPCAYQTAFHLHDAYPGAQLAAALDFLHSHRGQVSPITIDLGANDVNACNFAQACVTAAIATVAKNMGAIMGAIRAQAPSAEIIVMEYYNPYAAVDSTTNTAAEALNSALASDAAAVRGRLADAFTPFNLAAAEPGTLCTLTLFCTALHDIHASDAGYMVIAQQFWSSSGYGRLGD
jgi:lysophospholipase L1-like esterase